VVADDDVLVREGVVSVLERSGFQVVGQAGDARELLELVHEHEPELVIVDVRMPPTHSTEGLVAAQTIREEHPETGILVLSAHVEIEEASELLATGDGIGYLLKGRVLDVDEFVDSLRRIAAGGSVVDPGLVQTLVKARRSNDPLDDLTAREREVLALMAEGRRMPHAAQLWLAEGTVEKHVRHILPSSGYRRRGTTTLAVVTFRNSGMNRPRPRLRVGANRLRRQARLGNEPQRGGAAISCARSLPSAGDQDHVGAAGGR
jgi:serine/threonine-protein kinase PknK